MLTPEQTGKPNGDRTVTGWGPSGPGGKNTETWQTPQIRGFRWRCCRCRRGNAPDSNMGTTCPGRSKARKPGKTAKPRISLALLPTHTQTTHQIQTTAWAELALVRNCATAWPNALFSHIAFGACWRPLFTENICCAEETNTELLV
jgi:hypothetical protein